MSDTHDAVGLAPSRALSGVRTFVVVAAAAVALVAGGSRAWAGEGSGKPSEEQLRMLERLEPYVRYFTSLTYGPDGATAPDDLIRALILIESGADPDARSPMGARGLTQIIPSTARHALDQLASADADFEFVDEGLFATFEPEHLHDPALNILIACHLAAQYHAMYDGRTELVVAAWNAGPGAVARYGNSPPPYPETLKLIERVDSMIDYLGQLQTN